MARERLRQRPAGKRRPTGLTISGRRWRIRWVAPAQLRAATTARKDEQVLGLCHYDERVILISDTLSAATERRTLVHEILHAAMPRAAHPKVYAAADAICRALERLED